MARKFIRHPSDIPIEITPSHLAESEIKPLTNLSHGGLSFVADDNHRVGTILRICIPFSRPTFQTSGRVAWSRQENGHYIVGVEFLDKDDVFRMRMVEQVCYIEHYRKEVKVNEGRDLSSEQAAREWIERSAEDFPDLDDDTSDATS
jgi:hypothetical protein